MVVSSSTSSAASAAVQQQEQQREEQEEQLDDAIEGEMGSSKQRYHAIRHCTTGLEGPAIFWNYQDVQPYLLPQFVEYCSFDNILDAVEYIGNAGGSNGNDDIAAMDTTQAATTLADIAVAVRPTDITTNAETTTMTTSPTQPVGGTRTTRSMIANAEKSQTSKNTTTSPPVAKANAAATRTSTTTATSKTKKSSTSKIPLTPFQISKLSKWGFSSLESSSNNNGAATTNTNNNNIGTATTTNSPPVVAAPEGATAAATTKKRSANATTTREDSSSTSPPPPNKKPRTRKLPVNRTPATATSKKITAQPKPKNSTSKQQVGKKPSTPTATTATNAVTSTTTTTTTTTSKRSKANKTTETTNATSATAAAATTTTTTTKKRGRPKKGEIRLPSPSKPKRPVGRPRLGALKKPKHPPPKNPKLTPEQEEEQWETLFLELQTYYGIHGHSNVPQLPKTPLSRWVGQQRLEYDKLKAGSKKKSKMTPIRMQRLTELQFRFQVKSKLTFDQRCVQWLEWKTLHPEKSTPLVSTPLGNWVKKQRLQYEMFHNPNLNRGFSHTKLYLTQEQINKLTQWGFQWSSGNKKPEVVTKPVPFEQRFDELVAFKNEHGHTMVPQTTGVLGRWVQTVRKWYKLHQTGKRTSLTPERLKQLQDIGFVWKANRMGSRILKLNKNNNNNPSAPAATATSSLLSSSPQRKRSNLKTPPTQKQQEEQPSNDNEDYDETEEDDDDDDDDDDDSDNDFDTASEGDHDEHNDHRYRSQEHHQHQQQHHNQQQQSFPGLEQVLAGDFPNTTTTAPVMTHPNYDPTSSHQPGTLNGAYQTGGYNNIAYPPNPSSRGFQGYWG